MNPSTSLGTRSNMGMAKPSPLVRQAANIWRLLVIRGVYRRSVPSGCAQVKYRCRCRVSVLTKFAHVESRLSGHSLPDTFLSHYEIGICEVALSYTLSGLRTPTRRNTR